MFKDFHLTKMDITPPNMLQKSNFPIMTHLVCGCYGQPVTNKGKQ